MLIYTNVSNWSKIYFHLSCYHAIERRLLDCRPRADRRKILYYHHRSRKLCHFVLAPTVPCGREEQQRVDLVDGNELYKRRSSVRFSSCSIEFLCFAQLNKKLTEILWMTPICSTWMASSSIGDFIRMNRPSVCQSLFDMESKSWTTNQHCINDHININKPSDVDIGAYWALGVTGVMWTDGE